MRKRRDRRAYHIFCKQKQTEMMKKHFPYRTSRLAWLLFLGLFPFLSACAQLQIDFGPESALRKLQMAEVAINNYYVDSVDESKLVEDAIRGMLEKLIPIPVIPMPRRRNRSTNHCKAISRVLVCSSISLTTHWWSCSPPREALLRKWASSLATVLLPSMTPQ